MYRIFLLLSLLAFSPKKLPAEDSIYHGIIDTSLQRLKAQVLTDILSAPVNETEVMNVAAEIKEDGSWADIDYADKTRGGWPVNDHLVRLNNMAILYKRTAGKHSGDMQLACKIISGLSFWLKNDFICPNWWYPEIGVPKVLGPTMLLMEDKLTKEQKESGIKILNRAKIGMTGQNKVWLSGNVIYRSLLTGDVDLIRAAVKAIEEEVVVSEGEGIQADYSFHQHGPQQQFGNYGASFASDMLKWASIFQNTSFQFDAGKILILRNYLLEGMRWIIWNGKMDISACGRQLFPDAQVGKARGIETIFSQMPLIDPAAKESYLTALNNFAADKHFWRSDMTVHRRKNFYTSVKMSSNRVAGAESCNEENIQGYHLGDGATYFYQSGEEYTNIFPFWDWKLLPGVTTYHDAAPLPVLPCSGYHIATDFAGGVSNGTDGISTLAYNRDNLTAQKSWFFFDDAVICLGAGINSKEVKEVTTAVNQSFLHGDVLIKQGDAPHVLESGEHKISGASWVLHDKWGYFFPGRPDIELTNREQTGDWNKVLKRMPSKQIRANLFTLWFNHHQAPEDASYAYYVFAGASPANIDTRAAAITLVENSAERQVVESSNLQMAGLVFAQPGEATTSTFDKVTVDKPCVLLLKKGKSAGFTAVLSDPTHLQKEINVSFSGKRKSTTISVRYDEQKKVSFFTINLPQGAEAGNSTSFVVE